jgi:hypothetical protein
LDGSFPGELGCGNGNGRGSEKTTAMMVNLI